MNNGPLSKEYTMNKAELTFIKLSIGDKVYEVSGNSIPAITEYKVWKLQTSEAGSLDIFLSLGEDKLCILVPKIYIEAGVYSTRYLNKAEAEKKLEKMCIERIVAISKVIGLLNKGGK